MMRNQTSKIELVQLESVCHLITDGKHGDCMNEEGSGYYFLSAKDVKNGKLNYDDARQITKDDFVQTHKRTQLEPLDILVSNSGTIGRMAIAQDNELTRRTTFQKSVAILKPNKERVYPHWLLYYLYSVRENLINTAGGTAQVNLLLRDLRSFPVTLPPLSTQRRIADILSAYDDLIENNTRRIRILEQMAQAVYQEWFGKVDKESLPEGWITASFTDIIDVLGGGTPKTDIPEYWDGDIPWFTPRDLTGNFYVFDSVKKITKLGLSKCNSKLYPANTVFITARGTVGKCVLAAVPMAMSQTNYALVGKDGLSQYFVFLLTLSLVEVFKQGATGAVFDTIVTDTFKRQFVVKPPTELVEQFHEKVSPIFELILNLQYKNANLRQTRDLLLPRLVSGEIEVA